jgi:hypothetical protein
MTLHDRKRGFSLYYSLLCIGMIASMSAIRPALGQQAALSMAPLQIVSQSRFANDSYTQALVGVERSIPVAGLLPQVTSDSYFMVARLVAGARFNDGKTDFRMRLTGLDFEIQKTPWAGGLTLLDYDKTGLTDLNADWIGLRVGPGVSLGSDEVRFVARVTGRASLNSTRFGQSFFPDLGSAASDTETGISYGVAVHAAISSGETFLASASYDTGAFTSGSDLELSSLHISADWRLNRRVTFFGFFDSVDVSLGGSSDDRTAPGVGIRFNVSPPRY